MIRNAILFLFLAAGTFASAQDNPCLTEVLAYESALGRKNDSVPLGKTLSFGYKVTAQNQDDEVTESNVKVYYDGRNMNMFSEQANIYRNDNEVLMVLPEQKVLVLNSTTPELNSKRVSDEFLEMRKQFLKNCKVTECVALFGGRKKLVLDAAAKMTEGIRIRRITYDYDTDLKTVISVKMEYNDDYKLKSLMIAYHDPHLLDNYSFPALSPLFSDKKGKLLAKYGDFDVIDNREPAKGKKK